MKKTLRVRVRAEYYWRGYRREEWIVDGWEEARGVIRGLREDRVGMDEFRDWIKEKENVERATEWRKIRAELMWVELDLNLGKKKLPHEATRWIELPVWSVKYRKEKV